jgi:hypothetical protein
VSSTIWTRSARKCEPGPWAASPWRVVETQQDSSTRRLVDSAAEHELLEALLDESKPPVPDGCRGLHYLLFTPFRYPPLLY